MLCRWIRSKSISRRTIQAIRSGTATSSYTWIMDLCSLFDIRDRCVEGQSRFGNDEANICLYLFRGRGCDSSGFDSCSFSGVAEPVRCCILCKALLHLRWLPERRKSSWVPAIAGFKPSVDAATDREPGPHRKGPHAGISEAIAARDGVPVAIYHGQRALHRRVKWFCQPC